MKNVKVSIIVPVYNVKKHIEKCLDSILCQTFTEFEVLLVNDGSTDGSAEICESYQKKDTRIRVIHQQNSGIAEARNTGIKNVKGQFILFVDSDDRISECLIEKLYNKIVSDDSDMVVYDFYLVDEQGKIVNNKYKEQKLTKDTNILEGRKAVELLFKQKILNYLWCKIYKKELFLNVRFPIGRRYEDIAVMYQIFESAKTVSILNEKLYYYTNDRKTSITNDWLISDVEDVIENINEMKEYYVKVARKPLYLGEYLCSMLAANYIRLLKYAKHDIETKKAFESIRELYRTFFSYRFIGSIISNPYGIKMFLVKFRIADLLLRRRNE